MAAPDTAAIRAQMDALTGWTGKPHVSAMEFGPNVAVKARKIIGQLCDALDAANAEVKTLRACIGHITADIHDILGVATDDEVDAILAAWGRLNRPMPDTDAQVIEKLRAENEQLRGFMEDFAACKFERLERRARDPQDDLDPLTDYLAVEAWQDDARAALAQTDGDDR